ncbi:MAG: DUF3883 domain-containing protein [Pseudomonadota bacterium]|nr:DUF3883 domain-containing protein [Pseudomonadota bacterium]
MADRPAPWSREEVEATVASYFSMLVLELAGQDYNKTEHRNALVRMLDDRSAAAVELKHSNISAILLESGCPWIDGYKPRGNYQGLLADVVSDRVERDRAFNEVALEAVERPAVAPPKPGSSRVFEAPPELRHGASSPPRNRYEGERTPIRRDYLAREARNAALGLAGEKYVVDIERERLISSGKDPLADRVEHVSVSRGDGLGYDVLSFEPTGRPRLIEVKTTAFGKETPFYLSSGELDFSRAKAEEFQLYRLFNFRRAPRIFALKGAIHGQCHLDAISYRARFLT